MIIKSKEIIEIVAKGSVIAEVRKGLVLLWQSVRSCFGSGGWNNNLPWDNNDGWNNG